MEEMNHDKRTGEGARSTTPWLVFAALALGQLLVEVDDSVLNIALPSIARDLRLRTTALPWVVNAYALCFGGLLLLGGRLADRFGHRLVMLVGVGMFGVASVGGSLATSTAALVGVRGAEGMAAALIAPAAMGLLVHTFPDREARNRALGLWGAVTGSGAMLGLIIGGVVTQTVGWRWLFAANAIVAMVGAGVLVRTAPGHTGDASITVEPLGAVAVTATLVLLVHALGAVGARGWLSLGPILELGVGLVLAALVYFTQRGSQHPLVPRALWHNRMVVGADAIAFLAGAALLATFFFVSLHLQQTLRWSPLKTAMSYLPLIGGLFAGAGAASTVLSRLGQRRLILLGLGTASSGLILMAFRGVRSSPSPFVTGLLPAFVVLGMGLGLVIVALTAAAIPGGEGSTEGGVASGLYNTALQIGGAVGLALLATVARTRTSTLTRAGVHAGAALSGGRSAGLVVAAFVLLCGIPIALALPSGQKLSDGTGR